MDDCGHTLRQVGLSNPPPPGASVFVLEFVFLEHSDLCAHPSF